MLRFGPLDNARLRNPPLTPHDLRTEPTRVNELTHPRVGNPQDVGSEALRHKHPLALAHLRQIAEMIPSSLHAVFLALWQTFHKGKFSNGYSIHTKEPYRIHKTLASPA